MKKNFILFLTFIALGCCNMRTSNAQDFIGFNTHAYSGVTGVDINPANIVETVYRADINVGGASLYAYNNYLKFNPKALWKWSMDKDKSTEVDPRGLNTNVYANTRLQLPSAMFQLPDKSARRSTAFAFTWQLRTGLRVDNIGTELSKLVYEDWQFADYNHDLNDLTENQPYTSNEFNARLLSWQEIGLSVAQMFSHEAHRFKFGARLKYLSGSSAYYLESENPNYTVHSDSTLNVYNSSFLYGHTTQDNPFAYFQNEATGLGYDLGFKYSYKNQYVFGVSLVDGGMLNFDKAEGSGDFNMNEEGWYLGNTSFDGVESFDDTLAVHANFIGDKRQFKVQLPTALSFQAMIYLWEAGVFEGGGPHNVFIMFSSYHPLKMNGADQYINAIGSYTVTPGIHSISTAIGFPFTVNELGSYHLGLMLRLGPFVVGSKNLFTNLTQKSINESDTYFALKVPILSPKYEIMKGCPEKF